MCRARVAHGINLVYINRIRLCVTSDRFVQSKWRIWSFIGFCCGYMFLIITFLNANDKLWLFRNLFTFIISNFFSVLLLLLIHSFWMLSIENSNLCRSSDWCFNFCVESFFFHFAFEFLQIIGLLKFPKTLHLILLNQSEYDLFFCFVSDLWFDLIRFCFFSIMFAVF